MVRNKPSRKRPDPRGPRNGDRPHRPASPPRRNYPDSDNWRPDDRRDNRRDNRRDDRPPYDDYRPSDTYRPQMPRGEFTFRVEKPAGISEYPQDNYRGGGRRREGGGRPRGRGGYAGRRWQPPPHPSERALISGATANLPEERVGDLSSNKYRPVDELSDDDELEMDISSSEEKSETEGPSKKRARTTAESEAEASVPKWSNPDPYTALPCPDESQRKKKDVVKLIRKARLEEAKPAAPTDAEDFISFLSDNDDEDEDEDEESVEEVPPPPKEPPPPPPPNAPSGPRASNGLPTPSHTLPPRPDQGGPLGSRKRTADDVIKPPDYGQLKKATTKPAKGVVVASWMPKANEHQCPWATVDHSATSDMAFRLHKEIMDFYHYVRPREFEQRIRDNLVENLRKAMRRDHRNFASAQVHPFGSFMSGLYLPTADMDLVVCSASFMRGGPPTYLGAKSWLYKFQKFLIAQQVAQSDSIEVIAHARIPLVKFVDKLTGLKVDVSFENLGGVGAIDTFLQWKQQYPAMPILVTVIKHFLLMRGLNEPVNGGIGGFSVICLVVSLLQLMPQVQSRNLIPEHHLGEMLLEFFDLYGRTFDYQVNAISLTRPVGYVRKNDVSSFVYKNRDRLSIIDPNNPGNDISGGSSNTPAILARFDDAYMALRQRMDEVRKDPTRGGILDVIMKGDYSSFRLQRDYLRHIHEKNIGPCRD
ncbi:hypothetical protein BGZ63DRAFT_425647 [Mariannaea sp. PMI_226]|nr:hypothetical protein BGZ63DRAFT_425647 [Mariannaea sp. PMI_226]